MSSPREEYAELCRQAAELAWRVRASRWPGLAAPGPPRPAAALPALSPGATPGSGTQPAGASGEPPAWSSLEEVAAAVAGCRGCRLHATRTHPVPGEGHPAADLMFVGEAPGFDEDRQGRPFVGRAGQLLTRMIAAMGLGRDRVFIANVLKCRPPENRDPLPDEAAACLPFLRAQLALVRPRVVVALGKHAAQALLETKDPIGRLRGRFHDLEGLRLMPTFHPSYLLRNERDKELAWQDLKQVMAELGLPLPEPRARREDP